MAPICPGMYLQNCHFPVEEGGFPDSSVGKESACSEEDLDLIPGLGRPLEEEKATHSSILA